VPSKAPAEKLWETGLANRRRLEQESDEADENVGVADEKEQLANNSSE
jgi:hypothetical protein